MKSKSLCIAIVAGLFLPAMAFADTAVTPGWEFSTPGNESTNGSWTNGEVFVANEAITVGYLGYYDPTIGMNGSHAVGLYDASGNLLASSVVNSDSQYFDGHFLYSAIAPVTLTEGDTYVVEGVSDIDDYTWDTTGFFVNPEITALGQNQNYEGEGLAFNGTTIVSLGVSNGFWGPDFAMTSTPEPTSLLLLGSGMAGLAGILRRRLVRR